MAHLSASHARRLVGGARCELQFLRSAALPWELEDIARSLGEQSADGLWEIRFDRDASRVSLRAVESPGLESLEESLRRIVDSLSLDVAALMLEFCSATPIGSNSVEELLTESVHALTPNLDFFTQALSGTWDRGHYLLRFGVRPVDHESFFLSDCRVSALDIASQQVGEAFSAVFEECLLLLSLPIAPEALASSKFDFEHSMRDMKEAFDALSSQSALEDLDASRMNSERVELLARKHGSEAFTVDDEERLEALTQNVRRLMPRVTDQDWEPLEDVGSRLDEIEERTDGIRKKYRLA